MKRKKKVLLILVSIIFFCIWYWWMYVLFWSNALDRISVAADLAKDGHYQLFNKVKEIKMNHDDYEAHLAYEFMGWSVLIYNQEYLENAYEAEIYLLAGERDLDIKACRYLENSEDKKVAIEMRMCYERNTNDLLLKPVFISVQTGEDEYGQYYDEKDMVYQYLDQYNISEEDIREYQNYILYDVVVKTWTKAHGGLNFLERMKIGLCIEDHTFDFEYQE